MNHFSDQNPYESPIVAELAEPRLPKLPKSGKPGFPVLAAATLLWSGAMFAFALDSCLGHGRSALSLMAAVGTAIVCLLSLLWIVRWGVRS